MVRILRDEELVDRGVYAIRSRNLAIGAYDAEKKVFVGIREKFKSRYLFGEYLYSADPMLGTVRPTNLLVMLPENIVVQERLPGTYCSNCDRPCEWRRDSPPEESPKGRWFHIDDDTQLLGDDTPTAKSYPELMAFLERYERQAEALYKCTLESP